MLPFSMLNNSLPNMKISFVFVHQARAPHRPETNINCISRSQAFRAIHSYENYTLSNNWYWCFVTIGVVNKENYSCELLK